MQPPQAEPSAGGFFFVPIGPCSKPCSPSATQFRHSYFASETVSCRLAGAQFKHDQGVKRAENHAERLEWEASFAINYAVAAIEEAKSAALDAIVGRVEAEKAKLS